MDQDNAGKRNLEHEIAQTRARLVGNLISLEEQITDKIDDAKSKVEETVDRVARKVEQYSPRHQIQAHPIKAVAGATGVGLVLGMVTAGRTQTVCVPPSVAAEINRPLGLARRIAGELALAVSVGLLSALAKKAFPNSEPQVDAVVDSFSRRIRS